MGRRNAAASGWEAAPRQMGRVALQMRLLEAAAESFVQAEDPLPTKVNYFLGNSPRAWRTAIETSSFRKRCAKGTSSSIRRGGGSGSWRRNFVNSMSATCTRPKKRTLASVRCKNGAKRPMNSAKS